MLIKALFIAIFSAMSIKASSDSKEGLNYKGTLVLGTSTGFRPPTYHFYLDFEYQQEKKIGKILIKQKVKDTFDQYQVKTGALNEETFAPIYSTFITPFESDSKLTLKTKDLPIGDIYGKDRVLVLSKNNEKIFANSYMAPEEGEEMRSSVPFATKALFGDLTDWLIQYMGKIQLTDGEIQVTEFPFEESFYKKHLSM